MMVAKAQPISNISASWLWFFFFHLRSIRLLAFVDKIKILSLCVRHCVGMTDLSEGWRHLVAIVNIPPEIHIYTHTNTQTHRNKYTQHTAIAYNFTSVEPTEIDSHQGTFAIRQKRYSKMASIKQSHCISYSVYIRSQHRSNTLDIPSENIILFFI